jgi:hypothetical protein
LLKSIVASSPPSLELDYLAFMIDTCTSRKKLVMKNYPYRKGCISTVRPT